MRQVDVPSPASSAPFDDGDAVRVFRALGDCTRYKIVRLLVQRGEMGCSELHAAFPLSAPCMSHHTRILQECGLIGLRKVEGQQSCGILVRERAGLLGCGNDIHVELERRIQKSLCSISRRRK